jgi:biotin carboxylase
MTREEAISKMRRALDEFVVIEGIKQPFAQTVNG